MPQQGSVEFQAVIRTGVMRNSCVECRMYDQCVIAPALETRGTRVPADFKFNRIRLSPGEHLYWRDDGFHALYTVATGSLKSYNVDLHGNERVRGFHYPGDLIGFDGVEEGHYRCHVQAMEETHVCVLPFDRLLALSLHAPDLQTNLFRRLSCDLAQAETLAGDYPAEVRLAAFLLEIAGDKNCVRLPMVRRDIANYLRLATETVSRLMSRFRDSGLIRCRGRSVTLLDVEALKEIAEPSLSN